MPRRAALALLGAAVVLASGCQLRLTLDVDVHRGGGGDIALTVAADAGLLSRAEAAGADPLGDLATAVEGLPGWRVRARDDADGGREVVLSSSFDDPEGLTALTRDLANALDAPEVRLLEPLRLERDTDAFRFGGAAGLVPTEHVTELGLLPADAVRLARDEDGIVYRVQVRLPGPVLETNADERGSRSVAWVVPPGERVEMSVVGEAPPPLVWPVVAGGLLGAVAAGLAAQWWVRRRRLRARP